MDNIHIKTFVVVISLAFLSTAYSQGSKTSHPSLSSPNGYDIIKKQKTLDEGFHDESLKGSMLLIGAHGEKTEREFETKILEKKGNSGEKSIIRFLKPADIQGTALLSVQNKNRDDDQWLYLPGLKKTKRIIGTGKNGSFVGSEFSFEDLIPLDIDKYAYEYLKTEGCGGHNCFVVESRPKTADSGYSKTVVWIRTDIYKTVKANFYDKKERHQKTALFEDIRRINSRWWRPFSLSVQNHLNRKKTELTLKNVVLNAGLSDADFSQRALER